MSGKLSIEQQLAFADAALLAARERHAKASAQRVDLLRQRHEKMLRVTHLRREIATLNGDVEALDSSLQEAEEEVISAIEALQEVSSQHAKVHRLMAPRCKKCGSLLFGAVDCAACGG